MDDLTTVAPAFVEMAHSIVWASVATVGPDQIPRSRVLHPIWEWDGTSLVGWVATQPTAIKRNHLANSPYVSANYWAPTQDTCTAECRARLEFDLPTRRRVWDLFAKAEGPVAYDPSIIPGWTSPEVESFAALRLDPWRLRVMPGSVLGGQGRVLAWKGAP